jgi:ATP-dependent DNA helicase HFM1/MER3
VPLEYNVVGYPARKSPFHFDYSLNFKLMSVLNAYSSGRPAIVFCASRKGCQQAARQVVSELDQNGATVGIIDA